MVTRRNQTITADGQYQIIATDGGPLADLRVYRNRTRLLPQSLARSWVWQGKLEAGDFIELDGVPPLTLQVTHVDQNIPGNRAADPTAPAA